MFWIYLVIIPATVSGLNLQNVALNKTTHQSSTSNNGVPSRAVDGDTNQIYSGNSCTHTGPELEPYWEVDLGSTYLIDHIVVYNRDCCYRNMNDLRTSVSLDGTNYTPVCFNPGQPPSIYTCTPEPNTYARWVRLTPMKGPTYLHVCEVLVMSGGKARYDLVESVKGAGDIIKSMVVASKVTCLCHCIRNNGCLGVNMVSIGSGVECQLLSSDVITETNEDNIGFWKIYTPTGSP